MTYKFNSVLKKSKYLVTNHTSVQTTSSSGGTFVTLLGSEISYEPSENASKVVYEISFYCEKLGNPFTGVYLEHYVSGSWSEINQKYRKNWGLGGSTNQMHRWPTYFRFVLPAWSGERSLRIRLAHHAENRNINLHQITDWDGNSSVTDKFSNTNLIVYSI